MTEATTETEVDAGQASPKTMSAAIDGMVVALCMHMRASPLSVVSFMAQWASNNLTDMCGSEAAGEYVGLCADAAMVGQGDDEQELTRIRERMEALFYGRMLPIFEARVEAEQTGGMQ